VRASGTVDPRVGLELATLFEQVKENAERNRLLSRSHPFELDVERKITKPEPMLEARFVAYDTVVRSSERKWRYAPGKMLGTRDYADGVFAGRWSTLTMPELADFADEAFLNSHCFDFEGTDVVDGDTLLRIDFIPGADDSHARRVRHDLPRPEDVSAARDAVVVGEFQSPAARRARRPGGARGFQGSDSGCSGGPPHLVAGVSERRKEPGGN
jgi:hypothetical protein